MKYIQQVIILLGLCLGVVVALPQTAGAADIWGGCTGNQANTADICGDTKQATNIVKNLINTALSVIGILAVIMIIFSGFKYINSRGNAENIKAAKDTLLYSVIGLIVTLLSFAIVNFVTGLFSEGATPGGSDSSESTTPPPTPEVGPTES